jgi:hypothetical protein
MKSAAARMLALAHAAISLERVVAIMIQDSHWL